MALCPRADRALGQRVKLLSTGNAMVLGALASLARQRVLALRRTHQAVIQEGLLGRGCLCKAGPHGRSGNGEVGEGHLASSPVPLTLFHPDSLCLP